MIIVSQYQFLYQRTSPKGFVIDCIDELEFKKKNFQFMERRFDYNKQKIDTSNINKILMIIRF